MSLISCLKKAGSKLKAEDKAAILAGARTLRAEGMSSKQAGVEAINQRIKDINGLIAAQSKVVPEQSKVVLTNAEAQDQPDPAVQRAEAAKTELQRKAKAARLRGYTHAKSPFLAFLGHHGVALSRKGDFSPGKNPMLSGYGPMFRNSGKNTDLLVQNAIEEHFLPEGAEASDLENLIDQQINGMGTGQTKRIEAVYSPDVADRVMNERMDAAQDTYEQELAAQQETAQNDGEDPFAPLTALEYNEDDASSSGYNEATQAVQLEVNALLLTAEKLGIDTDEIKHQAHDETRSGTQQDYLEAARAALQSAIAAIEGSNGNSSADAGQQGNARGEEVNDASRNSGGNSQKEEERNYSNGKGSIQSGDRGGVRIAIASKSDAKPPSVDVANGGFKALAKTDGTLAVSGDPAAIRETLKDIPAKSLMTAKGGILVGKTQADKAAAILRGETPKITAREAAEAGQAAREADKKAKASAARAKPATEGLSLGFMPNNAEPITVKNGVVYVGKYPAQNFETADDITVPEGATDEQVVQALRDAGAITKRQRVFGLVKSEAATEAPTPTIKPVENLPEIAEVIRLLRNLVNKRLIPDETTLREVITQPLVGGERAINVNVKRYDLARVLGLKVSRIPQQRSFALYLSIDKGDSAFLDNTLAELKSIIQAQGKSQPNTDAGIQLLKAEQKDNEMGLSAPTKADISDKQEREYFFGEYGESLTMRAAVEKVKELEARGRASKKSTSDAPSKMLQGVYSGTASNAASLARKLRKDIDYQIKSYPQAKADYEAIKQPAGDLTAPTVADILDQQDRKTNADKLDDKEQIGREAEGQTLTSQAAPEQRTDTSGNMFGEESDSALRSELDNLQKMFDIANKDFADATPAMHRSEAARIEKAAATMDKYPDIKRRYKALADMHRATADRKESGQGGMFARGKATDEKTLLIQHNLTAENLLFADRMGGLAVPSLAITKANAPMNNFGEITLLGDRNMADPKQGIKAYGADIYSPRYPRITYELTVTKVRLLQDKFSEGAKATGMRIDSSELEKNGDSELINSPAVMWQFLKDQGFKPDVRMKEGMQPERLARLKKYGFEKYFGNTDHQDLMRDETFQRLALAMQNDDYARAGMEDLVISFDDAVKDSTIRIMRRAENIAYEMKKVGDEAKPDGYATRDSLRAQIRGKLDTEFDQYVKNQFSSLGAKEKMFQGYTDSGNRRYKPHTLENVIAILKKELRGGENFNYGAGSLRAKFTPQFRSIRDIKNAEGTLVSKEQFEAVKDEVNEELVNIATDLNKPTDTAIAIFEDAPRMGLKRAAAQYDIDLGDMMASRMAEFMTRLRNMPTEYFEGKFLRGVGIGEFAAAVVPSDVKPEVLSLFKREGVQVFTYKKGDQADRAAVVTRAAVETPDAMFARSTWRSALRDGIAGINAKALPGSMWADGIKGLINKGTAKADEVEWSGVNEFLKLQEGKVSKDQVLAYLDGNGVRVEETMLGNAPRVVDVDHALSYIAQIKNLDGAQAVKDAYGYRDSDDYIDLANSLMDEKTPQEDRTTKYSQYQLPGGENYKELLLTLPGKAPEPLLSLPDGFEISIDSRPLWRDKSYTIIPPGQSNGKPYSGWHATEAEAKAAALDRLNYERRQDAPKGYKSSHWDQANVVAHIRVNDRVDASGAKVLMVEEVQADLGQEWQKLKKQIEAGNATDADRARFDFLSTLPFTKTDAWLSLAIKRIIKMAVDGGYDKVAFVNGAQSAERYSLSSQVDSINIVGRSNAETGEKTRSVWLNKPDGSVIKIGVDNNAVVDRSDVGWEGKPLADVIGKEMADRVMAAKIGSVLSGIDLKVGGEGMKAFYDKIVPTVAKDVLRKLGGGQMVDIDVGHSSSALDDIANREFGSPRYDMLNDKSRKAVDEIAARENKSRSSKGQPGFDITPAMREKAAAGLPMFGRKPFDPEAFSRMFLPPTAMAVTDVQKAVDELSAKWKTGPTLKVVATPADLPINAPADARGLILGDIAYIVASSHRNRDDVAKTLGHEAIGHYGLWAILNEQGKAQGKDLRQAFERNLQLALKSGNVPLGKIRDKVRAAYVDGSGKFNLSPADEANEIAAFAVEAAIDPATGEFKPGYGFLKQVWADIAAWLRSKGIDIKFTNVELQGMLVSAMRGLEAGQRLEGGVNGFVAATSAMAQARGTTEAMTNPKDVVGNQGRRSADDYQPGTVNFQSFDNDERAKERLNRILDVEEEYRLPNVHQAVPKDYVPKEASQKTVTIYRGVPSSVKDAAIRPGDWVGLSKKYAADHGTGETGNSKVISIEVPADHVVWAGTDMNEWFYAPREVSPNESIAPEISNPNIAFARGTGNLFQPNIWSTPGPNIVGAGPFKTDIDRIIYELQDGKVDLKRVQEAIVKSGQTIEEKFDARLAETLYPGRVANRSDVFRDFERKPLLTIMEKNKVSQQELADYLHARHAPEANKVIAARGGLADGGAGTNTKGELMTTSNAQAYLAKVSPVRKMLLEGLAKKVDAITAGTRKLWVTEGLAKQEEIDGMEASYKHYVPLFREDAEEGMPTHPTGSGFAIKGKETKQRTGSTKKVSNIFAHVMMQREAAITRAEKNRVALALYGQALSHPNPDFWTTIKPSMSAAAIGAELVAMGVDPVTAQVGMEGVPTVRTVDPNTGKVVNRPNPIYRNLPGAIPLKVNGEDRVLMLNVKHPRGQRLAESLKNLDGLTQLDLAGHIIGKSTRWLAAVNTQYNPAFGLVNLIRDLLGGVINLGSTELRGKSLEVLSKTPIAALGIARELLLNKQDGKYGKLFRQMGQDGGITGFKENFRDPHERAKAIEKELTAIGRSKLSPGRAAHAMLDLLDGFNTTLENAVRLSAYETALKNGMSRPQAARLDRELTVDFNRKGRAGRELGPLYAFFNASVQGIDRTIVALRGPTGAKIIAGGIGLGVLQAFMLAAAGYDDDEIKEFVKTRALVIPTGKNEKGVRTHIFIPYPLGLHVLPNTGRVLTELTLNGGKDIGKRSVAAIGEIAGAFNPLGGGNIFTADGALKTIAPTLIDPIIELGFNKDFSDGKIEKESYGGEADGRPGWARTKESTQRQATGQVYIGISKIMNVLTGGNDYEAGIVSPTPERIRYLAQTVGGGVLRELEKGINSSVKAAQGEKVQPSQIPVLGRFYGEVNDDQVAMSRFYESDRKLKTLNSSLKAAQAAGDGEALSRMLAAHPEAAFVKAESKVQQEISKLNKLAVQVVKDPAAMREIDEARVARMKSLNEAMAEMEKANGKATLGDRIKPKRSEAVAGGGSDD